MYLLSQWSTSINLERSSEANCLVSFLRGTDRDSSRSSSGLRRTSIFRLAWLEVYLNLHVKLANLGICLEVFKAGLEAGASISSELCGFLVF